MLHAKASAYQSKGVPKRGQLVYISLAGSLDGAEQPVCEQERYSIDAHGLTGDEFVHKLGDVLFHGDPERAAVRILQVWGMHKRPVTNDFRAST